MKREEIMKEIGYSKTSVLHGIEEYQNKYGDKIIFDLIKKEVTKTSDYYRGWLKADEIEAVEKVMKGMSN